MLLWLALVALSDRGRPLWKLVHPFDHEGVPHSGEHAYDVTECLQGTWPTHEMECKLTVSSQNERVGGAWCLTTQPANHVDLLPPSTGPRPRPNNNDACIHHSGCNASRQHA